MIALLLTKTQLYHSTAFALLLSLYCFRSIAIALLLALSTIAPLLSLFLSSAAIVLAARHGKAAPRYSVNLSSYAVAPSIYTVEPSAYVTVLSVDVAAAVLALQRFRRFRCVQLCRPF